MNNNINIRQNGETMKKPDKSEYLMIDKDDHKFIDKAGLELYCSALENYSKELEKVIEEIKLFHRGKYNRDSWGTLDIIKNIKS